MRNRDLKDLRHERRFVVRIAAGQVELIALLTTGAPREWLVIYLAELENLRRVADLVYDEISVAVK